MAINPKQIEAAARVPVPRTLKEQAFRLYEAERLKDLLEDEILALNNVISNQGMNCQFIVRGDEFDLLVETLGSAAKVTRMTTVK